VLTCKKVFVSASWAYELEADGLTFRWAYPGKLWVVDDPQCPVQECGQSARISDNYRTVFDGLTAVSTVSVWRTG
jgi:hypothetical protein